MTLSNFISCLRGPLALLFLFDSSTIRVVTVFLAMLSDGLDGYLARRNRAVTQLGAMLDPLMDKFFVLFTGSVLLAEGSLAPWQLLCLIARDFSVALFGLYLVFSDRLGKVQFQSIWSGKLTTLLQFGVLVALSMKWTPPFALYAFFVVLAVSALVELFLIHRERAGSSRLA